MIVCLKVLNLGITKLQPLKPRHVMSTSRRDFLKKSAAATASAYMGALAFSPKSYARIIGANDRVRVGVVGFSDRFRGSLLPAFSSLHKENNFDIVGVSDIWRLRREAALVQ